MSACPATGGLDPVPAEVPALTWIFAKKFGTAEAGVEIVDGVRSVGEKDRRVIDQDVEPPE